MSQQAPVLCISNGTNGLNGALSAVGTFPLIDSTWNDALDEIVRLNPAAVIAMESDSAVERFATIAAELAKLQPYVPLIVINPKAEIQTPNAIPFSSHDANFGRRLQDRLTAALRVRTLHATVLGRIADQPTSQDYLPANDPLTDSTVLLIGRGASYPALSVALGEQMGVVGALSIEAAAKHLNARDLDGIVIGEGFSHRVIDAFLTVLSEDSRFRSLPIVLGGQAAAFVSAPNLPNFEIAAGAPQDIAATVLPMIRQQAFDSRLIRTLKALDAGGILDPRSGLLTVSAFDRNFTRAIDEAGQRGGGLSAARFVIDDAQDRICFDAARILSRLMRRMDFATVQTDGSIIVTFAETDLRTAHMVARRLASVLKHSLHGTGRHKRIDPAITLVTLLPKDSEQTLRQRLYCENPRAA